MDLVTETKLRSPERESNTHFGGYLLETEPFIVKKDLKFYHLQLSKLYLFKIDYFCRINIQMENLNRNIIISRLVRNEKNIKKFGVIKVGLFGSFQVGQENEDSDIDILVEFQKDKNNYDNFINLCFLMDELFLGRKVEVVTKNSLSPYIGPKILQQVEYVPFSS